jgi:hypothetical protein
VRPSPQCNGVHDALNSRRRNGDLAQLLLVYIPTFRTKRRQIERPELRVWNNLGTSEKFP